MDPTTLADMCIGRRPPDLETVQTICSALGLAVADVITFLDDANPRSFRGSAVYSRAMTITTLIATYAAALSTIAVAWQVYTWWERRRTKIEVRLFEDEEGEYPKEHWELVVVQVTNHSGHEVWINHVALKAVNQHRWQSFDWLVRWNRQKLPTSVAPGQQLEFARPAGDIAEAIDTSGSVIARVRLGDNSVRYSRPTRIDPIL